MHRTIAIVLLFVIVVGAGLAWLWTRDVEPPPPVPGTTAAKQEPTVAVAQTNGAAQAQVGTAGQQRTAATTGPGDLLDDPEIRAGLTGFRGRVVTHLRQPVADCGVRIYRGAMDAILPENMDLFAEDPEQPPQYVAGETRTAADGTFEIGGVWPRALYLMFAGIGTDAPKHQILTRTPSPGEIVDLGDVVLPDAAVIEGTVLDDHGEPLAGALVRAVDLPGSLAAFVPVERFDPEGAILIREHNSPIRVVQMPKWVKTAFEHLPIPSAHSDATGHFRVVGLSPGSNMVATTNVGFLSDVKPSIQVRAGQVKDIGSIRLNRGEELIGKVVDTAGKPVADAEVLAGSTLSVVPFDFARRIGASDAEGHFHGEGFATGKVTVAARRGKGQTWVLAEPQSILSDVVITLPATFGVDVTVLLADGKPASTPRLRLLQGRAGNGAAEMAVFGFVPPLDVRDRMKPVAEGHWRITDLSAGTYTVVADMPGTATAFAAFEISTGDVSVQLDLPARTVFTVRVLDDTEKPIRNASIIAESRGKGVFDMPLRCGRTDAEGRLVIDKLQGEALRVSADHPRWGVVHGEVKSGEELVLHMQRPGSLHGFVTENGKPAEVGKFTIAVMRNGGNGPRGPMEPVPMLLSPGVDGSFTARALQPGEYHVQVVKSLDALNSPGGVFAMVQDAYLMRDLPSESVQIGSEQVTEVLLEAGQKPIDGPTAHVFGTATVDGRLAADYIVTTYTRMGRRSARVDATGRFDLGVLPVENIEINLMAAGEESFFGGMRGRLWNTRIKLAQAEERELTIVVATSSLGGVCYLPDGSPAPGVFVQARGRMKGADNDQNELWVGSRTDPQGRFHFAQIAEGTWSLDARNDGESGGRGRLAGIVAIGGVPNDSLRIDMQKALIVKGRIEMAVFAKKKLRFSWIGFYRISTDGQHDEYAASSGINETNGNFQSEDLAVGHYRVRVEADFEGEEHKRYSCAEIDVPPQGLENLVLQPVEMK